MYVFFKSLSRSVHDDHESATEHREAKKVSSDSEKGTSTSFTVWRKSLLISCNGFTVIDSAGDLVYRVDNYSLRPQQLVLMDASGKSVLSMHRHKKLGQSEKWEVFEGEDYGENMSKMEGQTAIWSVVKRKKNIVEGYNNKREEIAYVIKEKIRLYVIEGSYRNRACKVMDGSRRVMAEIKRKDTIIGGVDFGEDVFVLVVHSGFDSHFAMALVLLLDQMFS